MSNEVPRKKIYIPVIIIEEIIHVKGDLYHNLFANFVMSEKFDQVSGATADTTMNDILIDFYMSICKFHGIEHPDGEEEEEEDE